MLGQSTRVAVKLLNNTVSRALVYKEVAALSIIHHRNIVKFFGWLIYSSGIVGQVVYVFEYAPQGTLNKQIEAARQERKSQMLFQMKIPTILLQVCLALEYLHKYNVVHRDLKVFYSTDFLSGILL